VTSYRRGIYREKGTAARFGQDGYFVMESRGSHGPCDLLAVKKGQVLAVQVKAGEADLAHEWVNELYRVSMACGMVPLVADWPKRGVLRLRRITGLHIARSQSWPLAAFSTDEAGDA